MKTAPWFNFVKLALVSALLIGTVSATLWARADKSMIGQPLPKLNVLYVSKKPDLTGKPMVLEFWATWCGPCRESIPHLNEVYKKYNSKGLEIVGVTKEDYATIQQFTKTVPIDYPYGTDVAGQLNKTFGVTAIPHAVVVDKAGKVVWEGHPMTLTDAEIEKVLQ